MNFRSGLHDSVVRALDGGSATGAAAGTGSTTGGGAADAGAGGGASGAAAGAGGAAAGAADAGGKGLLAVGAGAQPPADKGQQGQPAPIGHNGGPPFIPDGLPDAFKGKDDRETISKLAEGIKGIKTPPAKAEDYALKLEGDLAKRYGDMKDDPVLPLVKKVAHQAGLDNGQFQTLFTALHSEMTAAGLLEPPIDVSAEIAKLSPHQVDPVRRNAEAAARINAATGWLKGLAQRGVISQTGATVLTATASVAEGVIALEAIMKMTGEHGLQAGGQPGAGARTIDAIRGDMRDERYDRRSPKFDKAFHERVTSEHTAFFKGK